MTLSYGFSATLIVLETGGLISLAVITYGLFLCSIFFLVFGWIGVIILFVTGMLLVKAYSTITGASPR